MFKPFTCISLHPQEEQQTEFPGSPKKTRKNSFCKRRETKNPYSTRGLDKFSALLADLEDRRQKIYAEIGSDKTRIVRFVYPNSNDCVPIVVKIREGSPGNKTVVVNKDVKQLELDQESRIPPPTEIETAVNDVTVPTSDASCKWLNGFRRPSHYMPVMIIFILLLLAAFGRSIAIMCSSFMWYLLPIIDINASTSNSNTPTKKKELRRMSFNAKI